MLFAERILEEKVHPPIKEIKQTPRQKIRSCHMHPSLVKASLKLHVTRAKVDRGQRSSRYRDEPLEKTTIDGSIFPVSGQPLAGREAGRGLTARRA
jgi:hypothetical protein